MGTKASTPGSEIVVEVQALNLPDKIWMRYIQMKMQPIRYNSIPFHAIVLAVCMAFITCTAAQAELMVGDMVPKLQMGKWIQGERLGVMDSNHVYIVEFWATWCAPCIRAIPHLNQLWRDFKDKGVIVVGQDIWDSDDAVAPFVKKMGNQMTYRVALDDKNPEQKKGAMAITWMQAAGLNEIPTVFIVNQQGRIAWIGHPENLNEQVLNDIVSAQYDLAKAAFEYQREFGENIKLKVLEQKLSSALKQRKWDDAAIVVDEILTTFPKYKNVFAGVRLRILLGQDKYDEAYEFANSFSDANPNDSDRQNFFAYTIVTQDGVKQRNLKLAEKLAERANQSAGGTNAAILDTLARVQFMIGKTNNAVITEQKALANAPDEQMVNLKRILESYRHGTLPDINE
jgi:thiol-disulfide isomerase/thioredoxin